MSPLNGKIRIVHIITLLELGGAQQNTLYTVKMLDRRRFDLVLIAGKGGYLDQEALALESTNTILLEELVRPISPLNDFKAMFKIRAILKEMLKDGTPMIVHTHSGKAGVVGRAAARLAGVKTVVHHIHGLSYPKLKRGRFSILGRIVERAVDPWTHGFISVCHSNIKDGNSMGLYKGRIKEVIRSGFDTKIYHSCPVSKKDARHDLGIDEESPVIGLIACFKPQKNPLDFIRMSAAVLKSRPETQFIIAGDGVLRPKIVDLCRKLGVSKNIKLLGWREDIPKLLKAMDVLVLTSLWEGLPRVAPQALLSGVPVVATRVDGVPEVIRHGENGYLVDPMNPELTAQLVLRIIESKGACLNPGPDPDEYLHAFGQDLMVQEEDKFYMRLITRTRGIIPLTAIRP